MAQPSVLTLKHDEDEFDNKNANPSLSTISNIQGSEYCMCGVWQEMK